MPKAVATNTLRVFCGSDINEQDKIFIESTFRSASTGDWEIIFNKSGKCELAFVINYDPAFHWVRIPKGRLHKWLTEPVVVGSLARRFSWRHSSKFAKIYAPTAPSDDPRVILHPPFMPPRISQEGLNSNPGLRKTERLSVIASTLDHLEGHKFRNQMVELLGQDGRPVDIFGRGRLELSAKEDGLRPYMFSVAIENSFQENYWTEKITDCFLTDTVPVYLGAPNIGDFFAAESYVELPRQLDSTIDVILESLGQEEYEKRLPFVLKEKSRVLSSLSLGAAFAGEADATSGKRPQLAFQTTVTIDTVVAHLMVAVAKFAPGWAPNLSRQLRLRRHKDPVGARSH